MLRHYRLENNYRRSQLITAESYNCKWNIVNLAFVKRDRTVVKDPNVAEMEGI